MVQLTVERVLEGDLEQETRAVDAILKKIILKDNEIIEHKTKTRVDV